MPGRAARREPGAAEPALHRGLPLFPAFEHRPAALVHHVAVDERGEAVQRCPRAGVAEKGALFLAGGGEEGLPACPRTIGERSEQLSLRAAQAAPGPRELFEKPTSDLDEEGGRRTADDCGGSFVAADLTSGDDVRRLIAQQFPHYYDEPTKAYCEYVARAATAPAMTTVTGWAIELVQTVYANRRH